MVCKVLISLKFSTSVRRHGSFSSRNYGESLEKFTRSSFLQSLFNPWGPLDLPCRFLLSWSWKVSCLQSSIFRTGPGPGHVVLRHTNTLVRFLVMADPSVVSWIPLSVGYPGEEVLGPSVVEDVVFVRLKDLGSS